MLKYLGMLILSREPARLNKDEKHFVQVMQALGDPTRFKIYKILRSEKMMCVSEIAEALKVSVPAVSQHFRIFELVGMVGKKRMGQKVCYELKHDNRLARQLMNMQ